MRRFRLETRLHDFLTGECDEATRREVEHLLAHDGQAKALFEEMREAHEALLVLRERPAPDAPVDAIRDAIRDPMSAGRFTSRPEPELAAWGARFYKRLAAASVLVCGVSLGLLAYRSFEKSEPTITADPAARRPLLEIEADRTGEISALDFMRRNRAFRDGGKLVTFTPTDAVMPTLASNEPADR